MDADVRAPRAPEPPEGRQRMRAVVRGRVQGVGFRFFAAAAARRLDLRGQVRNLPDRSGVEVVAEGERPALDDLVRALRQGPPLAEVESVNVAWCPATGGLPNFTIRAWG